MLENSTKLTAREDQVVTGLGTTAKAHEPSVSFESSCGNKDKLDLYALVMGHKSASHSLFQFLRTNTLNARRAGALLRNYDAHAAVLRRLLLKAASTMPEEAVGYVLENVRTEFGSGNIANRHQLQLLDLARQCGVSDQSFAGYAIETGVKFYIRAVCDFYVPSRSEPRSRIAAGLYRPAVVAGAITATEILAIEEFKAMQIAFASFGLDKHIWFDHVTVEENHSDDSLALAHYFMRQPRHIAAVLVGMNGVLDATEKLYDGLLSAVSGSKP